jgi:hypothetical protein
VVLVGLGAHGAGERFLESEAGMASEHGLNGGGAVRSGELVAATHDNAYLAAERVRQAIQLTPFDTAGTLTLSMGVVDPLEVVEVENRDA